MENKYSTIEDINREIEKIEEKLESLTINSRKAERLKLKIKTLKTRNKNIRFFKMYNLFNFTMF